MTHAPAPAEPRASRADGVPASSRLLTGWLAGRLSGTGAIWPATAVLFLVSPLIAPGSVGASPVMSMLPFAAVLALAATGQAFVVQQRGLDLSVPGSMSLAALVVTKVANQDNGKVVQAVVLALVAVAVAGLINGLVVTRLRITPIVATLGVNALLLGAVQSYSAGFPTGAASSLNSLALRKTLGVPNTVLGAALILAVLAIINQRTLFGRRLVQVGTSPQAMRLIGGRVQLLVVSAYVLAAAFYGLAGIMLAAYIQTPGIFLGDDYLLPTIAAVVLAGNALTGGQLKVGAIAVAALFLTQLNQVVLSMGAPTSLQLLIQSAALVVAVSGHLVRRAWRTRRTSTASRRAAARAATLLEEGQPWVSASRR
jgi:ribose transport system permease protein